MFYITRHRLDIAIIVHLTLALLGSSAWTTDFNPFPNLPYEATSLRQDEWVSIAKRMMGDSVEKEPIDACQKLIDDPTTPFELKRWATLRQVELFTYCRQEPVALEISARWLARFGNVDPDPLEIRAYRAGIVGFRGHSLFRPAFEDIRLAYEDIFRNHPGNEWPVIDAHLEFAQHCNYRYAETGDVALLEDRVSHLMLAESKIREHIAAAEQAQDNLRKQQFQKALNERVTSQLDNAIRTLQRRVAAERPFPAPGQGGAQASQDRPQSPQGRPGSPPSPPRP